MRSWRASWESQLNRLRSVTDRNIIPNNRFRPNKTFRSHACSLLLLIIFILILPLKRKTNTSCNNIYKTFAAPTSQHSRRRLTNAVCLWYISIVVFFFSPSFRLCNKKKTIIIIYQRVSLCNIYIYINESPIIERDALAIISSAQVFYFEKPQNNKKKKKMKKKSDKKIKYNII